MLDVYDYQVCPISFSGEVPNWSNAFVVHGGYNASKNGSYGKYIAIRSLGNASMRESISQTLVVPVQVKETLTVNVWGNGSVSQTNSNGKYFVGDKVTLTAKPVSNAAFRGWFINGDRVSMDATYILEMYKYADITAKFEGGENVAATNITLTLMDATNSQRQAAPARLLSSLESLRSTPATTVYVDSAAKLVAEVEPENVTDKAVVWVSSDETVATVDENGIINFISAGDVIITATLSNGVSNSYTFTVLEKEVTEIHITNEVDNRTCFENEDLDLTGLVVVAEYSYGDSLPITEYSVSGFNYEAGTKTVTLTFEGKTTEFGVEVIHKATWSVTKAATCSETGIKAKRCSICGETIATEEIETIDHDCTWIVAKQATEDENSEMHYICKNCGEVVDRKSYEYCNHIFVSVVTEPTCDLEGFTTKTCSICGEVLITDTVEALGHEYEDKVVAASCGKAGYTLYTCSICGDKYITDKTPALEHEFTETTVVATCSTYGCIRHTCNLCGEVYDTDITDTIPHTYNAVFTDLTCTNDGFTTYTCSSCGDVYTADEVEALEHVYVDNTVIGDCETGTHTIHTCSVCGYTYTSEDVAPSTHIYGEWLVRVVADEGHAGIKYRICTICGHEDTAAIPVTDHNHIAGEWYIEKDASCNEYGVRAKK